MERVRQALAAKPDGVIEAIAREVGVSTLAVLEAAPDNQRRFIPAERFEALWLELSSWGTVLFIVHTPDIVLECEGSLPVGSFGHGYYNIHGDSPIGGHIKAGNCQTIALVDRQFHGRRSCSVQFFNGAGEAMFKVFVRRDEKRELLTDQVAKFEALQRDFV
ncbi:heme utilization cystosolic carrier protein HutX [Bosea rubneri]|uniref:Heme utilization cystosolic carrier protein HutX n=1 Tax=Bosea rubneri TaxID=3075434 RepID=A0ABU3S6J4_9HYPH|nr:heme utilization cystosolic carrier protein HutX [Bosea sp. ZW T0_25]MDU0340408.1 heme utilization cystosolic carrier protein HutX [Bosea sp. ZW T0_25]